MLNNRDKLDFFRFVGSVLSAEAVEKLESFFCGG